MYADVILSSAKSFNKLKRHDAAMKDIDLLLKKEAENIEAILLKGEIYIIWNYLMMLFVALIKY